MPYFFLGTLILVLDRLTKWWIDTRLALNQTISVIDGLFNITYVQNTGVAFGILDGLRSPMKSALLSALTIAAIAAVVIYALRTPVDQRFLQVALCLILAGALGNLYDRLFYGYVIDFIEVYVRSYRWPSFNVADSVITAGVALLALEVFRSDRHEAPGRS